MQVIDILSCLGLIDKHKPDLMELANNLWIGLAGSDDLLPQSELKSTLQTILRIYDRSRMGRPARSRQSSMTVKSEVRFMISVLDLSAEQPAHWAGLSQPDIRLIQTVFNPFFVNRLEHEGEMINKKNQAYLES